MKVLVLLKTAEGGFWSVPLAAELHERGHEVTFALPSCDGRLPELVRSEGMGVVRAEAMPVSSSRLHQLPGAGRLLHRQLSEMRPDIVVSHLYASALVGRLATRRTAIPHIFMSPGPLYLDNRMIRFAERVLCRMDAHIICSSEVLLRSYLQLGVQPDRLSLIYYTLDPRWFARPTHVDRQAARAALGLDDDDFVVSCVAYFYGPKRLVHGGAPIKGHDVLLDAWAAYRRGGGRGELLIVGDGWDEGGTRQRAELMARHRAVPGVRWIGRVADVRPFLLAADVNVVPSRSENLGGAAEAAALGVPSIASAVGGLPEIVRDGETGWLVPPAQPEALADRLAEAVRVGAAERDCRGEKARDRATELFDRDRNAAEFADLVEQVAGHRG